MVPDHRPSSRDANHMTIAPALATSGDCLRFALVLRWYAPSQSGAAVQSFAAHGNPPDRNRSTSRRRRPVGLQIPRSQRDRVPSSTPKLSAAALPESPSRCRAATEAALPGWTALAAGHNPGIGRHLAGSGPGDVCFPSPKRGALTAGSPAAQPRRAAEGRVRVGGDAGVRPA